MIKDDGKKIEIYSNVDISNLKNARILLILALIIGIPMLYSHLITLHLYFFLF